MAAPSRPHHPILSSPPPLLRVAADHDTPQLTLEQIHNNAPIPLQVVPPRLRCVALVVGSVAVLILDVRPISYTVQILVYAVEQER